MTKLADKNMRSVPLPGDTDPEANRHAPELGIRLREAVSRAGGPSCVSAVSGVPLRSLNHYLGGRDMKRPVLVALADACEVSIEWLATGRGAMDAGAPGHIQPAAPAEAPEPPSPLDTGRLVTAIRLAAEGFEANGSHATPEWMAMAVSALYRQMMEPRARPEDAPVLARMLTAQWFMDERKRVLTKFPDAEDKS